MFLVNNQIVSDIVSFKFFWDNLPSWYWIFLCSLRTLLSLSLCSSDSYLCFCLPPLSIAYQREYLFQKHKEIKLWYYHSIKRFDVRHTFNPKIQLALWIACQSVQRHSECKGKYSNIWWHKMTRAQFFSSSVFWSWRKVFKFLFPLLCTLKAVWMYPNLLLSIYIWKVLVKRIHGNSFSRNSSSPCFWYSKFKAESLIICKGNSASFKLIWFVVQIKIFQSINQTSLDFGLQPNKNTGSYLKSITVVQKRSGLKGKNSHFW